MAYWRGTAASASGGKFWEISFDEADRSITMVTFGSLGSNGQTRSKDHASADAAQKYADKQVKAKEKKGYSSAN